MCVVCEKVVGKFKKHGVDQVGDKGGFTNAGIWCRILERLESFLSLDIQIFGVAGKGWYVLRVEVVKTIRMIESRSRNEDWRVEAIRQQLFVQGAPASRTGNFHRKSTTAAFIHMLLVGGTSVRNG